MAQSERRRHARVEMVTRVTLVTSQEFHYYYSRDLSLGGMFLDTKKPYPMGSGLLLDFALPQTELRVRVKGVVVRVVKPDLDDPAQASGMGISFTEVKPESMAELKTYLAQRDT